MTAAVVDAQAKQMLELLERPAERMGSSSLIMLEPEILNAFLEGSSWAESFDAFFLAHCELFADFSIGSEHSLQQTDVHLKFVATAEGLLDGQLAELAVSETSFLAQLMADAAASKPAAAVMRRLEECIDFEAFGTMMRRRHESVSSQIDQLEQANDLLQARVDAAKAAQAQQQEDATLAEEQLAIRKASERRRRAREDAVRRAAEAAQDLDVLEASPQPEPEPEPEPRPAASPSPPQPQPFNGSGSNSWQFHPARVVGPILPQNGWEVGSIETGVVSYWDAAAGWGKIKRMAMIINESESESAAATGAAVGGRVPPRIGKDEIFVHNLQLPMDAPKRWLRRGEAVQFRVGVAAVPKGPQATAVVGVGADGSVGCPLLCQQPPLL